MGSFRIGIVLAPCLVFVAVCSGAFVDRYERATRPTTAAVNASQSLGETTPWLQVDNGTQEQEDDMDDDFSGDYDLNKPKVAFSTKPKNPSMELTTKNKRKGKGRGKGKRKGKKQNPCLGEFKDFCFHGVCHYLSELRTHSCICDAGYSGERCHTFTLSVAKAEQRYSRTTALAVIAVVLSLMCLTVIALLLALRYHKKDNADVEREEKVKLEATCVP